MDKGNFLKIGHYDTCTFHFFPVFWDTLIHIQIYIYIYIYKYIYIYLVTSLVCLCPDLFYWTIILMVSIWVSLDLILLKYRLVNFMSSSDSWLLDCAVCL